MGTRVILLRHGQSTYNAQGRYQGCCDQSVLTRIGRQMATQTGDFLRGIHIDAVYTSPLQRAQDTTRHVLTEVMRHPTPLHSYPPIHVTPLLKETDLRAWQGLPIQAVREQCAADYQCWKQTPHRFAMDVVTAKSDRPESSSSSPFYPARDVYTRLSRFWQDILPHHRDQTLLVVAHGGTNRAAIATALGISSAHYHTIQQSNCALNVLHFPNGQVDSAILEAMNLAPHMGTVLPTPQEGGCGLRLLLLPIQSIQDSTAIEDIRNALATVPIHFSLSSHHPLFQQVSDRVLACHPETVAMPVRHADFSELWQRAQGQSLSQTDLITGLVIAPVDAIAPILARTIGLLPTHSHRLQLTPTTLSSIHFPATVHPPILQAMNVLKPLHSVVLSTSSQRPLAA